MAFVKSDGTPVNFDFEKTEQELCKKYINKHATVLELGARYGTVSYVINKLLINPTNHVAVDPDQSIIPALILNRDVNNCKFHIFDGVISGKKYKQMYIDPKYEHAEYGTYTQITDTNDGTLKNISLDDLQRKFDLTFDCLVADCEGFLYDFIMENIWFLDQLNLIIYEQDGSPWAMYVEKYEAIDNLLLTHGFRRVESIPHPKYKNNIHYNSVWIKHGQ